MASIIRHGKGWQAQIAIKGIRRSRKFATKQEAKDWAAREEYLIREGQGDHGPGTLADLFRRYAREVSPGKRGAKWEILRLEKIAKDKLGAIAIRDLRPGDFADWRDRRLREVQPSSVRREMILMSAALSRARKEWGLIQSNPLEDVERPPEPQARDRLVSDAEIERLEAAVTTESERRAILAFRFAIETAMRAGEIARLRRSDITGSVALLRETKSGHRREVPLSSAARALLDGMGDDLFGMSSGVISELFARVRKRAGIEGLTFHDSRHEAITRLAGKVHILALARIVGHRDLKMLQRYYNETAADLARRLG